MGFGEQRTQARGRDGRLATRLQNKAKTKQAIDYLVQTGFRVLSRGVESWGTHLAGSRLTPNPPFGGQEPSRLAAAVAAPYGGPKQELGPRGRD